MVGEPRWARAFQVQVLADDYTSSLGAIPGYLSCSVTWQRLGVGTGTLIVAEHGDAALQLLQARDYVVPVTIKAPGYPRWSGRVVHFEATRDTGATGTIQATLVDDTKWLQKILAAPVPGAAWSGQSAAEHDVRSGPIVTVTKAYVQANLDRLAAEGRPAPLVVVPTSGDTSPSVTLAARNVPVQSLLVDALRLHGYDLTASLWLPGDEQPPGLSLSTPVVVVDVVKGRDAPYVRFTDTAGGVTKRRMSGSHPQALGVVVGGPGEGTARIHEKVMATDARIAQLGKWGFPEEWLDATDAEDTATRTARGLERLDELAGTASVTPEIGDRRPWQFGPDKDAWVNDKVRAEFSGVTVEDHIDRVTLTDNRDGFTVSPQFGAARDSESSDVQLARTVAQVRQQLAAMQARR